MKLMPLLWLLGSPAFAYSTIDWNFPLSSGKTVTFEMTGAPSYCFIAQPTATFTIGVNGQTISGTLCQQSTNADEFFGQFPAGADGQAGAFFIDIGPSYTALMKQYQEEGAGGSLGNSQNGQCVEAADAFLQLPGPSLGDGNDIIGFCMDPEDPTAMDPEDPTLMDPVP